MDISTPADRIPSRRKPLWRVLYFQVLVAIALGVLLGHFYPATAVEMKPLGDGFIKLIKMVIGFVVFFTVVSGISGMRDLRKVGRVGLKSLLYFEVVSTFALLLGMLVANVLRPGAGFNADPAKLDSHAVAQYATQAHAQGVTDFLLGIIPDTVVGAFARGDILPVVLVAVLFGAVLAQLGEAAQPLRALLEIAGRWVFGVINVLMHVAPIGAFGAMAFTIGRYGVASLGPLAYLVGAFYLTSALFVIIVLGVIGQVSGFNIFRLLAYIKEELLVVLGTSSSDPVLPTLMEKLERLGASKSVVGLVVPTGYVFNTDGSSIYMTMAALFVAQATNTDLTLTQQVAILAVAMLTSKGASGVTGAGFIALVGTLQVVPSIPVAGLALILGVDRFMSEARALVNTIGNAVATLVMARWEGELDVARMDAVLSGRLIVEDYPIAIEAGALPE
jgi:aerobic C4-dicarboxylate transport protein